MAKTQSRGGRMEVPVYYTVIDLVMIVNYYYPNTVL